MAKFITIQSNITITVTKDMDSVDVTKMELKGIKDNIKKVLPNWVGTSVQIKQGQGQYPAEIKDWYTVKALQEHGVLTIGAEVPDDKVTEEAKKVAEDLELAEQEKEAKVKENEKLNEKQDTPKQNKKLIKDISLDEATE